MSLDRPTPVNPHLSPVVATEAGNGNGRDHRRDDDDMPFNPPRSPAEVAANAALEASGRSGEAMRAAMASQRSSEAACTAVDSLSRKTDALESKVDSLRGEVSEIARAVGAKRSYASLRLSIPPSLPTPPMKVDVLRHTGEHPVLTQAELDRIESRQADTERRLADSEQRTAIAEAEERGAREYAERLEAEKAEAQTAADRLAKRNDRILKLVLAVPVIVAAIYGAGLWLVVHFH